MSHDMHVGIVGAGVVGLSTALWLQRQGVKVTIIDRQAPGNGASFGNAGLFADYARLPFANMDALKSLPNMLLDKKSPLSLQAGYMLNLIPYGWRFVRACMDKNYQHGRAALTEIQNLTVAADNALFDQTATRNLIKAEGCLGLFSTTESYQAARDGSLAERARQGVAMELLSATEVKALEPDIADFHAGGVFYPNTRFTLSPVQLCQRYSEEFLRVGGELLCEDVIAIQPAAEMSQGVDVQLHNETRKFDRLVVAAGAASTNLLKTIGLKVPVVSERGYHLTLNGEGRTINRPVGWLDKAIFITPMQDGLRVAGTAEFAAEDAPRNEEKVNVMLEHASEMLGAEPEVKSSWVGSRPSTPDSLPVIGQVPGCPQVSLAFGHGHLGVTLGAITGQLIGEQMLGLKTAMDLTPFAVTRFG